MRKEPVNANLNTAYDDAYHTLLNDCPKLIIPVINEVFHEDYNMDEKVIRTNEKYYINRQPSGQIERIADSNVKIRNRTYHLECQSTVDGSMIIRMFEYGSQTALQDAEFSQGELNVEFPNASVIYLRHNSNTPDSMKIRISVPGDGCAYTVPVLKAQIYTIDELFEKNMFFLIPFHIFVYEKNFEEYEKDEGKLKELQKVYANIINRLDLCARESMITEYEKKTIVTMAQKVLQKIAMKYLNVKERIGEIMGGKVLDYEAKDILNQGIEQGKVKKSIQIAERMLEREMSIEDISACTDLTIEEILELKKNTK